MHLAELQAALGQALSGQASDQLRGLVKSLHLPPDECLQIYRVCLQSARAEALRQTYPVVYRLLGPRHFTLMADIYGAHHPEPAGNRHQFGEHFARLLGESSAQYPELNRLKFLPELAWLEWLLHCAWCAADDPPLNFTELGELPEAQQGCIRFSPSHALRLMHSQWPVFEIWHQYSQPEPRNVTLADAGGWICVYRWQDEPRAEKIDESVARLLAGILKGLNLYELSQSVPEINQYLAILISRGWINSFEIPDSIEIQGPVARMP